MDTHAHENVCATKRMNLLECLCGTRNEKVKGSIPLGGSSKTGGQARELGSASAGGFARM